MSSSATIQVRVDEPTKRQAKAVLDALHLSMSEAVCLFLRQVVLRRAIPFEIKIPNELTDKILRESEEGVDLHATSTVDELFEELDRGDSSHGAVQEGLQAGKEARQKPR
jgi:DNA-damage-inducible protein J